MAVTKKNAATCGVGLRAAGSYAQRSLYAEICSAAGFMSANAGKLSFSAAPSIKDGVLSAPIDIGGNMDNMGIFNGIVEHAESTVNALCRSIGVGGISRSDYSVSLIKRARVPTKDFDADVRSDGRITMVEDIINSRTPREHVSPKMAAALVSRLEALQGAGAKGASDFCNLVRSYQMLDTYAILAHEMLHVVEYKYKLNGIEKMPNSPVKGRDNAEYAEKIGTTMIVPEGFASLGEGMVVRMAVKEMASRIPDPAAAGMLGIGVHFITGHTPERSAKWFRKMVRKHGGSGWKGAIDMITNWSDARFDPHAAGLKLIAIIEAANRGDRLKTLAEASRVTSVDELKKVALERLHAAVAYVEEVEARRRSAGHSEIGKIKRN